MRLKNQIAVSLAALLIILSGVPATAEPLSGFEPGIENVLNYQEVVLLPTESGKPPQAVLLQGIVKGPKKDADKEKSPRKESYTYTLTGKDASIKRTVTLNTVLETSGEQTIEKSEVTSFKETLTIGGKTYKADNKTSQFTQTIIHQRKPAVDYYSGNMSYMKKYTAGKDDPAIIVSMEGSLVGYDQFWGATETRTMDYQISTDSPKAQLAGSYSVKSSNNITKDIEYIANQPTQISFRGGYMISMKDESVMQYSYDINGYRGGSSLTLANNPVFERLYIPAYQDTAGHWAERSIGLIASIKAMNPDTKYFSPSTPISREEFAKAVSVASHILPEQQTKARSKKNQTEQVFADVTLEKPTKIDKKNPPPLTGADYIKKVSDTGVMSGVGEDLFDPDGVLTKAQAATILINALGFHALAPNGNYATGYADDNRIPFWAKDSVFLAKEIGLITGTENNYFQPDKPLTRAEAAAILDAYIRYMTYELREDYRERIINY